MFLLNNLPECPYSIIMHFSLLRHGQFRNFFYHIILHLRIFFIINIKSALLYHKAVFIAKKSFFVVRRIQQHQHFFSAKMLEVYTKKHFRYFHRLHPAAQKPPDNLFPFEIFFSVLMNLLPHGICQLNVFLRNFFTRNKHCTSDKKIACPGIPFRLPHKNSQAAFFFLFILSGSRSTLQKCIYIVLHIDPVILIRHSYLPYISGQLKNPFISFCTLLFILVDNLYHVISPLQASE